MTRWAPPARKLFVVSAILLAAVRGPAEGAAVPRATRIDLSAPPPVMVGKPLTLEARLADGRGMPIAGAPVRFSRRGEFFGVSGDIALGERRTGKDGRATVSYVPTQDGSITVTAGVSGSQTYGPGRAVATLSIRPGPQLYEETPWARVPGIVWLLMGLLAAVWAVYLTVMALLVAIAHDGRAAAPGEGS